MLDIPCHKISVFLFALLHDNLIKHSVFWIGQLYIKFLRIYIQAVLIDRVQHIVDYFI